MRLPRRSAAITRPWTTRDRVGEFKLRVGQLRATRSTSYGGRSRTVDALRVTGHSQLESPAPPARKPLLHLGRLTPMYSTCLFCNGPLGANAAIEPFPVGERLAFDAAKGRLWVVCRRCERWNLTPLEERWEAIEECERAFRATRLRVSTDEIGLARLKEGLELVRIGEPQRPEMAAWRYGDQFGRRRRRQYLIGGGAALLVGTVVVAGPMLGILGAGAISPVWNIGNSLVQVYRARKLIPVPAPDGRVQRPRHVDRDRIRLWM